MKQSIQEQLLAKGILPTFSICCVCKRMTGAEIRPVTYDHRGKPMLHSHGFCTTCGDNMKKGVKTINLKKS